MPKETLTIIDNRTGKTYEIPIDIVNLAAVKLVFAKMGTQKCFVIVSGHKTDFLAVDLVRDLHA